MTKRFLKKPERDAKILRARAEGKSLKEAGSLAGVSEATACRVVHKHEEWVLDERRRLQRKVLQGLDAPVRARLKDAANPDSRTGPASFRELREGILDWGARSSVVIGDVNVDASQTVSVDARSVQLTAGDVEARSAEAARLDKLLGL